MLQRKQYFNKIEHIFIQFIEVFRPNHSNIKWLINRPCGTELVNADQLFNVIAPPSCFLNVVTSTFARHSLNARNVINWKRNFKEKY